MVWKLLYSVGGEVSAQSINDGESTPLPGGNQLHTYAEEPAAFTIFRKDQTILSTKKGLTIKQESDEIVHGRSEFWLFPAEQQKGEIVTVFGYHHEANISRRDLIKREENAQEGFLLFPMRSRAEIR